MKKKNIWPFPATLICPLVLALLLLMTGGKVLAQPGEHMVTGRVIDSAGRPIAGVSIRVKGTNKGASTDSSGMFRVNAAPSAMLMISNVGYLDRTISAGSNLADIRLLSSAKELTDVVVVGYGTQKRVTVTGSIATVDAKAFQDRGPIDNPIEALQGTVPGVVVTRSSAQSGADGWSMQIGGATSYNGSNPLVMIDGVAMDNLNALYSINPSDIASISFLKDAAASAIYGSRAAGGVVLVTTKKATPGKTVIEYDGSVSDKIIGLQPKMMNFKQYGAGIAEAFTNDNNGTPPVTNTWYKYAEELLNPPDTGYYDFANYPGGPASDPLNPGFGDVADLTFFNNQMNNVLFGASTSTQHSLSISGGSNKDRYRLSFGYMGDGSQLRWGTNYNRRYNVRFTNDYQVIDKLKIETNISFEKNDFGQPTMLGSVLTDWAQPTMPIATKTGLPYTWGGQYAPNWEAKDGGADMYYYTRVYTNLKATYSIVKHLNLVGQAGYNASFTDEKTQQNAITWGDYNDDYTAYPLYPTQANTYYKRTFTKDPYYSLNAYLEYHNTFHEDHEVGLTLGTQYERDEYSSYYAQSYNQVDPEVPSLGLGVVGAGTVVDGETDTHYAYGAYFGRGTYAYKDKYLLEVTGRYDGASEFLAADRWKMFYGISGGWRITQENFMRNQKVFNELKLRVSYGSVGNAVGAGSIPLYPTQLLNYSYSTSITSNQPILGTGPVVTVYPGSLVTPNLYWESVKTMNGGLDFTMLQNHLSGTVNYFIKRNVDMILSRTLPATLGATAPPSNSGSLRTWGYDASLTWSDKIGKVGYHIGGVITENENKLVNFGGQTVIAPGYNAAVQGYPIGSYFGLKYAGRIQTQQQLSAYEGSYLAGNNIGMPNGASPLRIGDNMYADVNHDGKLTTPGDLVYLGRDDPRYSYSFNFGVNYAGFDASAIFQGVMDRTVYRTDTWDIPFQAFYLGQLAVYSGNTWETYHTNARYPKLSESGTYNNYNYQASSFNMQNGAYIRLKNVVLGYTIPEKLLRRSGISRLRFYFSGQDLWEHDHIHDGWDPEATRTVTGGNQRFPFYRMTTFGANLTF